MKKKVCCLAFVLGAVCLTLFGCGTNTLSRVQKNTAELTKVFYMGEGENFYVTLSSGEREENYAVDGVCNKAVPYALVSLHDDAAGGKELVEATISLDGQAQEIELEKGAVSSAYMFDLEKELSGNEAIEITYNGQTITLENKSKDFGVNFEQALEIAATELSDKILLARNGSKLNAECYLRVLDQKANNFDEIFWCFTVVNTRGENYSVVFSTVDGHVLAKSE